MKDSFKYLNKIEFLKKIFRTLRTAINSRKESINLFFLFKNILFSKVKEPIFIFGCPRSGTTFLGKLISEIPNISYYFEPEIIKYYSKLVYDNQTSFKKAYWFYKFILNMLMKLANNKNRKKYAEKTPRNIFIAEVLFKIYPNAKFINIYRDGRDVACSLLKKPWQLVSSRKLNKREPGGYLYGPFPFFYIENGRVNEYINTSDLHRCIWIWRRHIEKGIELLEKLPSQNYLTIKYEDLLTNPEKNLKKLLIFLNEYNNITFQKVLRAANSRYLNSIGRWKKELSNDNLEIIYEEAKYLLKRYHYL